MLSNKFKWIVLGFFLCAPITNAEVLWKRSSMLKNDLAKALSLPPDKMCFEVGTYSCIDLVHNFALGGRDPFARAQYQSMDKPSQLTPPSFERTILLSCIERIKQDAASSPAEVFRFYPLNKPLNAVGDIEIGQQIQELYQRFYQRPATEAELKTALTLADRQRFGATGMDFFSQALCLAVGSQWAYLFF